MFIRDVVGHTSLTSRLSHGSSWLNLQFFTSLLEGRKTSLVYPGRSTCTDALIPVPRLVGQE